MKGLGAAGAATVSLSSTAAPAAAVDWSSIGITAGSYALFGPAVAVGWALREFEVFGSDSPPEGLTADALKNEVYKAARKRKSTNASTIVDNQNILDGVEHTAYTDAKIAAIEELNAGSSESAVLDAANAALDSYETTVHKNFLKTWNEAVNEALTLASAISDHPDLSSGGVFEVGYDHASSTSYAQFESTYTETVSFPDGSEIVLNSVTGSSFDGVPTGWGGSPDSGQMWVRAQNGDGDSVRYLEVSKWQDLNSEITTTFQNVRDGISTWVTNVYSDVQSGDIEITDLVTPRERAAMMAEEEGMSQAISDLIALNIPVDAEREATITMSDTGATISGTFGLTDPSDGPIESGATYDTSTFAGDAYFTADMSLVEGDWSAIETAVDGGTITITSEPYDGTAIEVTTVAGETVSVPAADWSAVDGSETWTYDASSDLETQITEVDSARFVSTATETQYETFQIQGSFTVDKLVNKQTGEEATSTTFENSEPQTDSNYITQEEWDDLEKQNQELIEKYENAQSGGGVDLGAFDMFGIPGEIVVIGAGALAALGVLSN